MSTQDYYQQSIQQNYEEALYDQSYQQPYGMQNFQRKCANQVKEFTFFKELLFLIYHCITFGNFELNEIKCSWIVTIFSNIIIAIFLLVLNKKFEFKFDHEFRNEILKTVIFFILSGIVKIFLFILQHFVNAFGITPFLVSRELFNIKFIYNFYKYFKISDSMFDIISIFILFVISYIRIIFETHKFLSKKRFEVSIILSLVVCFAEMFAILWIFK